MKTRLFTMIALPCVALALQAAPAKAQPMPDQPPPPPPPHHGPMHPGPMHHGMGPGFFARFDLNHDGRVTKQEFDEVGNRMFAKLDRNHDGVITPDEMPRGPEGRDPMADGAMMGGPKGRWMRHCEPPMPPPGGPVVMEAPAPVQDGAPGFAQKRPDDPSYKLWTATPVRGYVDRDGDTY